MLSKIQELPAAEIPVDDPRWELVQRVVGSPEFHRATRLREFLLYVCQCAIRNDPESATEHQIGIHVFGCAPGYDSNVVRSQARQLRMKLESHFANSGGAEPVCVVIPKGSYLPEFRRRTTQPLVSVPETVPSGTKKEKTIALATPVLASGALILLLAGAAIGVLLSRRSGLDTRNPVPPPGIVQALAPRPGQHLNVIMEDFGLHILDALGVTATRAITLDDYASGNFLQPGHLPAGHAANADLVRLLSRWNVTGAYAMPVVSRVFGSLPIDQIFVKHAREVTSRDFENDNSLLIGGPHVNPWVQMFEEKLNFRNEDYAPGGGMQIHNQSPRPGEQAIYATDRAAGVNYGRIAYLPNLTATGTVMLVGGPSSLGTVASAEFIVAPSSLKELLRILGAKTVRDLPPFEVIIEADSKNGVVTRSKIVAWRKHDSRTK